MEELLEALHDPRFFVRFEAIVSIARHGPDPRLTDALIEILEGNEPALSTTAAWGLGRIEDDRALEALRRGLTARYLSVQAHCARSLGNLGDRSVLPELLDRLVTEEDVGLRMAFASALGKLGATEAIDPLLDLLRLSSTRDARTEFTLALARLVGEEHHFIQLQRRAESDPGTVLSQAVTALKGKLVKAQQSHTQIEQKLDDAAQALAVDDLPRGVELMCAALQLLPAEEATGACGTVVRECVDQMAEFGARRIEYVILALHAFDCALGG
jgi:HEAT repeat protein